MKVPWPELVGSMPGEWVNHAACSLPVADSFFPDSGSNGHSIKAAKALCARCPVIAECRTWAIAHGEHGIWGGQSEKQRRDLRGHL